MKLPHSQHIILFHDGCIAQADWPESDPSIKPCADVSDLGMWITENHRHNCLLWAQEDLARRTKVSDADIAANKRAIDKHNQARNDAIERMDESILLELGLLSPEGARTNAPVVNAPSHARLNSETAGSMVDRMSILSLKINAMHKQSLRDNAAFALRAECHFKSQRLGRQRLDLASCLDQLLLDTANGDAWFQVYRQFKMYNDPRLNPALLAEQDLLQI